MSWLARSPARLPVLLALCAASGCGDHATALEPSHGHVSSPAPSQERAPDAGAVRISDTDEGALSVTLTASPRAVCPGACSELSAHVQGGRPPYRLRWDHGASGQAERVCPSRTTTYQLEVEDTGVDTPEFWIPPAQASASVTVAVRSDCAPPADGGAPPADGGAPVGEPPSIAACALRIPVEPRAGENPWAHGDVDADAAGNLYVAVELSGSAELGPGTPMRSSPGISRVLIAKYAADCSFAWARWLGQPHETTSLGSFDVDDAGRLAVSMTYYVNLPGQVPNYHSRVVRLTPDGAEAWTLRSQGGVLSYTANGHGLAWGADGTLALMGLYDLCAGDAVPGSARCVAKVSDAGEVLFARVIGGARGAGVALDAAGSLYAGGLSEPHGVRVSGLPLPEGAGPFAFVTKFDAEGEPQWLVTHPLERKSMNWIQGFVNVASDGGALAAWTEVGGEQGSTRLVQTLRVLPSGAESSRSTIVVSPDPAALGTPLAGNAAGELITAVAVWSAPEPGAFPSTTSLTRFRPDDSVAGTHAWAESLPVTPMRVRLAPHGQLLVASSEMGPSDTYGQTALVVRRLNLDW